MIAGNGNIMMVKCDICGKEAEAPESFAVIHFAEEGWDLFNRDGNGEMKQICDDCRVKHDPSTSSGQVIEVDEMYVV